MRKKIGVVLLSLFVLSFAIGVIVTPAQARPPCMATCINGVLWVCCPGPIPGVMYCYWDGPCNW